MLKILSWNIQQGGGTRHLKIIDAIKNIDPHIVVLSEFRNNSRGLAIRNALERAQFKFQIWPETISQKNCVLLASSLLFKGSVFPKCDPNYAHSIVKAEFEAIEVYGCYLPHKKKHQLIPFLQDQIEKSGKPSIIVGDLNIGVNGIDQKGNSFWYQDELEALFESGVVDAFRVINGQVKEYSWYSHQGNGYRYDHSYVSTELKNVVTKCYYLHSYREQKCADHSPMVLEL